MSILLRYWHVPTATLLMATQPLLTEACLNQYGGYDFLMISVTLCAEVLKLILSISMYVAIPELQRTHRTIHIRSMIEFAIPGAVYFLNNNLVFFILAKITSTEFQILSCLKTVFTAVLFRCLLSRLLSITKWAAIMTLACGAAVSQLDIHTTSEIVVVVEPSSGIHSAASDYVHSIPLGVVATLGSSILSSFAGVYNEVLLKRDGQAHSIHLQNVILYTWGVIFNTIGMGILYRDQLWTTSFFTGFDMFTWLLVLNNTLSGLAISAVLKFANNIVRVFAHAGAMTITAVIGSAVFGHQVTPQLILSIMIVTASTISYAADGPTISAKPEATRTLLAVDRVCEKEECEINDVCETDVQVQETSDASRISEK